MHRFSIFIKENKFYWNTNNIIYTIGFTFLGMGLFKEEFLQLERNIFDTIIAAIGIGSFGIGVVLKFYNFNKIEQLEGRLEGFLIFEMDKLIIGSEIFTFEKIRNIEISNEDYRGKMVNYSKGNFGPALSNGTDNKLKLKLYTGEVKFYDFELYESNDFQKIKNELINYYLSGKIEFENLANVLGDKKQHEIEELKYDIEKFATSKEPS